MYIPLGAEVTPHYTAACSSHKRVYKLSLQWWPRKTRNVERKPDPRKVTHCCTAQRATPTAGTSHTWQSCHPAPGRWVSVTTEGGIGPVLSEGSSLDTDAGLLSTPWAMPQGASQERAPQDSALKHTAAAGLFLLFSCLLVPKQCINRQFLLLVTSLSLSDGANQSAATGCGDLAPQDTV